MNSLPPSPPLGVHFRKLRTLALATILLAGCGGGRPVYPTKGKVTYPDGTPISAGRVNFRPVDDPAPVVARGELAEDGTFELTTFDEGDGALEGRHLAIVMPRYKFDVERHVEYIAAEIDPRYYNYETSGLEFTVTDDAAENEFTLVVEPPGN